MEHQTGVTRTRQLSALQWQLMMKCWKHNLRPGQYSWWGPMAWRIGALFMWLYRLRKLNGPSFTWPLMMFAGVTPERILQRLGKIHVGKPLVTKSRQELIASLRPNYLQHLRADNGDLPNRSNHSAGDFPGQSQTNVAPSPRSLRVLLGGGFTCWLTEVQSRSAPTHDPLPHESRGSLVDCAGRHGVIASTA
jgi:hypothetical protein